MLWVGLHRDVEGWEENDAFGADNVAVYLEKHDHDHDLIYTTQ